MNRPIKKKVPNKDEEEAIKEAFNKFDLDGDGYLDNHEMRRLLNKFGIKCTEEEVVDIIKEADYKRDGKIDFKEFHTMMMKEEEPKRDSIIFGLGDPWGPPPMLGTKSKTNFH